MKIKRLNQLKFKHKMVFAFGVMIFLMVLIAAFGLLGINLIHGKMNHYINDVEAASTAVKMCRIDANNAARSIREMALTSDLNAREGYKATADSGIAALSTNLGELRATGVLEDALYQRYEAAIHRWVEIGTAIEGKLVEGDTETAVDLILTQCSPALQEVIDLAKEIDGVTERMKDDAVAQNERTVLFNIITTCALLVAAVLLAVSIAGRITRSVVKPMAELQRAATDIAGGSFETRITYQSEDEMGVMASDMNATMAALSGIIGDVTAIMNEMAGGNFNIRTRQEAHYRGQFYPMLEAIRRMNDNLSDTMRQIRVSSGQVAASSEQVSSGAQSLAQGAAEQASTVDALMSTMNVIKGQVESMSVRASQTNGLTVKTGEEILRCNEKMEQMMAAMAEIGQKSDEIKKIIKSIEDIAFQTNILSLNAAVEAARAGAAGKGFSVVAEEVRNLATRSAEASQNTSDLIASTIQAVQKGSGIAQETAKLLEEIAESSKPIVENVTDIAEAAKYQTTAALQIADGIEEISSVVQLNSATAEEEAAASEELSGQAQLLEDLIKRFILKERSTDGDAEQSHS